MPRYCSTEPAALVGVALQPALAGIVVARPAAHADIEVDRGELVFEQLAKMLLAVGLLVGAGGLILGFILVVVPVGNQRGTADSVFVVSRHATCLRNPFASQAAGGGIRSTSSAERTYSSQSAARVATSRRQPAIAAIAAPRRSLRRLGVLGRGTNRSANGTSASVNRPDPL